jgi:hypothetical protein
MPRMRLRRDRSSANRNQFLKFRHELFFLNLLGKFFFRKIQLIKEYFLKSAEEEYSSIRKSILLSNMESFDESRAKASSTDLIFPGHDVKMLTNFPKEAEGITRLV